MNIHEYQAKELLAKFGVAVPKGIAALSVEEAVAGLFKDSSIQPAKLSASGSSACPGASCG